MEPELAILGRVVTTRGIMELAILSDGERILDLVTQGRVPHGTRILDRGRYLIFPGFVDLHVHCRDLGQRDKEDWYTCTSAAAAGGVTTVFDMPNTVPPTRTKEALEAKLSAASRAVVDYGIHLGFPKEDLWDLARGLGIRSVKLYPEDLELGYDRALRMIPEDFLVIVHAEDSQILRGKEALASDPGTYAFAYPPEAEVEAVRRLVSRKGRIHITHLSTKGALESCRGSGRTFDVTPHHCLLDSDMMPELGNLGKVRPPLRPPEHRMAIMSALISGQVPAVGSDHAPHTPEEKLELMFEEAPPGFPGLETTSHLLLTLCIRDGLLRPEEVLRLYARGPSEILGLRRKGLLAPRRDLDLAVVDPRASWKVDPSSFLSKAKFSPFAGWEMRGKVVETYVRGELVYSHGEVLASPGLGEMVRWK